MSSAPPPRPRRPLRLPAIDALARGIANLRANAELVIVQFCASLFVAVAVMVPIALLLERIGVPPSILFANDPEKLQETVAGIELDPSALLGIAGVTLLVALVGGTLLFLFYCWAQAGLLAVLSAGDAQAPQTRAAPVEVYRTFSWRGYFSWSFQYGWRYFWIHNLYGLFFLVPLLLLVGPLVLFGRSVEDPSQLGAACLVGCGLSIPILFICLVLWLALQMSGASMVVEKVGVGRATRRGLSLTGRRFGGLMLLVMLLLCGSVAIGVVTLVLELGLGFALAEASALKFALSAGIEILKFLLSTVLALVFSAALVALVRGEARAELAAEAPTVA